MAKYVVVERIETERVYEIPESDVITLTEAARLLGLKATSSIRSLIERGNLTEVRDPGAKSAWSMRRVLLSEVRELKARRDSERPRPEADQRPEPAGERQAADD